MNEFADEMATVRESRLVPPDQIRAHVDGSFMMFLEWTCPDLVTVERIADVTYVDRHMRAAKTTVHMTEGIEFPTQVMGLTLHDVVSQPTRDRITKLYALPIPYRERVAMEYSTIQLRHRGRTQLIMDDVDAALENWTKRYADAMTMKTRCDTLLASYESSHSALDRQIIYVYMHFGWMGADVTDAYRGTIQRKELSEDQMNLWRLTMDSVVMNDVATIWDYPAEQIRRMNRWTLPGRVSHMSELQGHVRDVLRNMVCTRVSWWEQMLTGDIPDDIKRIVGRGHAVTTSIITGPERVPRFQVRRPGPAEQTTRVMSQLFGVGDWFETVSQHVNGERPAPRKVTVTCTKVHRVASETRGDCGVCLDEMKTGQTLTHLNRCPHVFHAECVDNWLDDNKTCPTCRSKETDDVDVDDPRAQSELDRRTEEMLRERERAREERVRAMVSAFNSTASIPNWVNQERLERVERLMSGSTPTPSPPIVNPFRIRRGEDHDRTVSEHRRTVHALRDLVDAAQFARSTVIHDGLLNPGTRETIRRITGVVSVTDHNSIP